MALRLAEAGVAITITDPQALPGIQGRYQQLTCQADTRAALEGAQLVLLLTEWQDYRQLDPAQVASWVARPAIIDGRNALDKQAWLAAGWDYRGLGR